MWDAGREELSIKYEGTSVKNLSSLKSTPEMGYLAARPPWEPLTPQATSRGLWKWVWPGVGYGLEQFLTVGGGPYG